jgi:hypothetical protein
VLWLASLGALLLLPGAAPAQQDAAATILAAQVRRQGFPCDEAQSAVRDQQASRPNEAVWVLQCKNTAYRLRLVPGMGAKVSPPT